MADPSGGVVIDADRHIQEPADLWVTRMPDALRARAPQPVPELQRAGMLIDGVQVPPKGFYQEGAVAAGSHKLAKFASFAERKFAPDTQVESMDVEGIDLAVLFPTLGLQVMGVDGVAADVTTAAARAYNDWLAEYCAQGAGRLFGAAMIDPRDVDAACAETRRAVQELGFACVYVRPNPVLGRRWSDPVYDPLWSTLEDLDTPICWHEGSVAVLPQVGTSDRRLGTKFTVWHVATHPLEQQLTLIDLVMEGVLERHPKLRCGFMECGVSWLPYMMWRMDEHAELDLTGWREQDALDLSLEPSEYVARQCWVSAESDETHAPYTLEVLGDRNVVWASDWPHADATYPGALDKLRRLPGLGEHSVGAMLGPNPLALFNDNVRAAADRRRAATV